MRTEAVEPAGVTAAAPFYSPAILAEGRRMLFISGQGPRDVNADLETQVRQTFEQIRSIVQEAGGDMGRIPYWKPPGTGTD